MAVGTAGAEGVSLRSTNYTLPMVLMVSLYFSIGFITALNDILIPHFKDLFHLTNVLALLVQFCFFGAYFVMSMPAGWVVGRIGYKAGIIAALCTMGCGLLVFVPASTVISYPVFLFALFVVGSGLALLQVAINPYVGAEVAIGSILIAFLGQPSMGGLSHARAAFFVSLYWGGAMIGRLVGSVALLHIRADRALAAVAAMAMLLIAITIFGHGSTAMIAIVSCGLFNSVMWPCIFPLSVKGLGKFTSQGSGILVMMVVGGAVIPEIQGLLADKFGYQYSFVIVLLCYAYLVYFALRGYRIRQPRFASLPDYVPPVAN